MLNIRSLISISLALSLIYGCGRDEGEQSSMSGELAGTEEPIAGTEDPTPGTEDPNAGTEEPSAGTESTAGTEEPSAGAEDPPSGEGEGGATPGQPELSLGLEDDFSREACELLLSESAELIATNAQSEAGQVTLLPSSETSYRVKLSDTGVGYLTLEVPDWSIVVGIFTHSTQSAKIITSLQDTEIVGPLSANASCVEFTDERVHFHSWGAYVLELTGEPNSEVQLALIKQQ